jgi:hypothetical protein
MPDIELVTPCIVSLDEPDADGFDTYVFPQPGGYSNVPAHVADHWYAQAHLDPEKMAEMEAAAMAVANDPTNMGITGRQVKTMVTDADLEAMDEPTREAYEAREAANRERAQQALERRAPEHE